MCTYMMGNVCVYVCITMGNVHMCVHDGGYMCVCITGGDVCVCVCICHKGDGNTLLEVAEIE